MRGKYCITRAVLRTSDFIISMSCAWSFLILSLMMYCRARFVLIPRCQQRSTATVCYSESTGKFLLLTMASDACYGDRVISSCVPDFLHSKLTSHTKFTLATTRHTYHISEDPTTPVQHLHRSNFERRNLQRLLWQRY